MASPIELIDISISNISRLFVTIFLCKIDEPTWDIFCRFPDGSKVSIEDGLAADLEDIHNRKEIDTSGTFIKGTTMLWVQDVFVDSRFSVYNILQYISVQTQYSTVHTTNTIQYSTIIVEYSTGQHSTEQYKHSTV